MPSKVPDVALKEQYVHDLFRAGHGYPVWHGHPEEAPSGSERHEVELGSVIYLTSGEMMPRILLNTVAGRPQRGRLEGLNGAPAVLNLLQPPPPVVSQPVSLAEVPETTKKPQSSTATPEEAKGSPPTEAERLRLSRTPRLNKMIEAPLPGPTLIDSKRLTRIYLDPDVVVSRFSGAFKSGIVRYIADNLDHWLDVGSGDMRRPEDLFFVHGTTKAMYWINEVYLPEGDSDEKKRFGFIRNVVNRLQKLPWLDADRTATVQPPNHNSSDSFYPRVVRKDARTGELVQEPPHRRSTVFFNYFKAKKRTLSTPIQYLKDRQREYGLPKNGPPVPDPVEYLLEYMLSHTSFLNARIAIASDTDLYAIFHDFKGHIPEDIPSALRARKPHIQVENGVATVWPDWAKIGFADPAELASASNDTLVDHIGSKYSRKDSDAE
ncbi:hypothetical protein VTO73DRAFT_11623 [Trametes versicolor]